MLSPVVAAGRPAPAHDARPRSVPLVMTPPELAHAAAHRHRVRRGRDRTDARGRDRARDAIVALVLAGAGASILPVAARRRRPEPPARSRSRSRPGLRRAVGLVWRDGPALTRRAGLHRRRPRSTAERRTLRTLLANMVIGLAFLATAVATLFAQATLVRFTRDRRPQDLAWTISLAMFALASAALATGVSTGWDNGTFRVFFLLGAVLTVPVARARDRLPPRGPGTRPPGAVGPRVLLGPRRRRPAHRADRRPDPRARRSRSAATCSARSRGCSPRSAAASARSSSSAARCWSAWRFARARDDARATAGAPRRTCSSRSARSCSRAAG